MWQRNFTCPPGGPDWECPEGKPWGWRPDPPATAHVGGSVKQMRRPKDELSQQRLAVCKTCDRYSGATCEQLYPKGCCFGKWLATLRRQEPVCPLGLWPEKETDEAD